MNNLPSADARAAGNLLSADARAADMLVSLSSCASQDGAARDAWERNQTTIMAAVSCRGIGIHSGDAVRVEIAPAPANTGIMFIREDIGDIKKSFIPAHHDSVGDYRRATTIRNCHGVSVSTVEHLLAALAGLGIDNVVIRIDGGEVPIMDGSARDFVELIEGAGRRVLSASRTYLRILEPIRVETDDAFAMLIPEASQCFEVEVDFPNCTIGRQRATFSLETDDFGRDFAGARTFCRKEDVDALRERALGLGGSLENTIVIDGHQGVENKEGLRWDNEIARHKLLDAIGDLYLLGMPIIGRYRAFKAGHALNHKLRAALRARKSAFEYVYLDGYQPAMAAE